MKRPVLKKLYRCFFAPEGLFGSATNASPAGGVGLFGALATSQQNSGATAAGGSLFANSALGSPAFGSPMPSSTGGLFSSGTGASSGGGGGGLFGSPPAAAPSGGGLFGGGGVGAAGNSPSGFGAPALFGQASANTANPMTFQIPQSGSTTTVSPFNQSAGLFGASSNQTPAGGLFAS